MYTLCVARCRRLSTRNPSVTDSERVEDKVSLFKAILTDKVYVYEYAKDTIR